MFRRGHVTVPRLFGVPVHLHWSLIPGAFLFGRFAWAPGAWLAFALVILAHELGHAVLVRRLGARPTGIELHALGGECGWRGEVSPLGRSVIAWGGVLAQLLLAACALPLSGVVTSPLGAGLVSALLGPNLWLVAINLIPVRPLDGAEAWLLVPRLLLRRRRPPPPQRREPGSALLTELVLHDELGEIAPQTKRLVDDLLAQAREKQRSD